MLDEPSSALDEDTADAVIGLVVEQARATGRSIVMVTHSKAVARNFADERVVLKDGQVVSVSKKDANHPFHIHDQVNQKAMTTGVMA